MKYFLLLSSFLLLIVASCTKASKSSEIMLNNTEQKLKGRWILDYEIDSSNEASGGLRLPGYPEVSRFEGNSSLFLELRAKKTGVNTTIGEKYKDAINALYGETLVSSWYYDESSSILWNAGDYELLAISDRSLVIRTMLNDLAYNGDTSYSSLTHYLKR